MVRKRQSFLQVLLSQYHNQIWGFDLRQKEEHLRQEVDHALEEGVSVLKGHALLEAGINTIVGEAAQQTWKAEASHSNFQNGGDAVVDTEKTSNGATQHVDDEAYTVKADSTSLGANSGTASGMVSNAAQESVDGNAAVPRADQTTPVDETTQVSDAEGPPGKKKAMPDVKETTMVSEEAFCSGEGDCNKNEKKAQSVEKHDDNERDDNRRWENNAAAEKPAKIEAAADEHNGKKDHVGDYDEDADVTGVTHARTGGVHVRKTSKAAHRRPQKAAAAGSKVGIGSRPAKDTAKSLTNSLNRTPYPVELPFRTMHYNLLSAGAVGDIDPSTFEDENHLRAFIRTTGEYRRWMLEGSWPEFLDLELQRLEEEKFNEKAANPNPIGMDKPPSTVGEALGRTLGARLKDLAVRVKRAVIVGTGPRFDPNFLRPVLKFVHKVLFMSETDRRHFDDDASVVIDPVTIDEAINLLSTDIDDTLGKKNPDREVYLALAGKVSDLKYDATDFYAETKSQTENLQVWDDVAEYYCRRAAGKAYIDTQTRYNSFLQRSAPPSNSLAGVTDYHNKPSSMISISGGTTTESESSEDPDESAAEAKAKAEKEEKEAAAEAKRKAEDKAAREEQKKQLKQKWDEQERQSQEEEDEEERIANEEEKKRRADAEKADAEEEAKERKEEAEQEEEKRKSEEEEEELKKAEKEEREEQKRKEDKEKAEEKRKKDAAKTEAKKKREEEEAKRKAERAEEKKTKNELRAKEKAKREADEAKAERKLEKQEQKIKEKNQKQKEDDADEDEEWETPEPPPGGRKRFQLAWSPESRVMRGERMKFQCSGRLQQLIQDLRDEILDLVFPEVHDAPDSAINSPSGRTSTNPVQAIDAALDFFFLKLARLELDQEESKERRDRNGFIEVHRKMEREAKLSKHGKAKDFSISTNGKLRNFPISTNVRPDVPPTRDFLVDNESSRHLTSDSRGSRNAKLDPQSESLRFPNDKLIGDTEIGSGGELEPWVPTVEVSASGKTPRSVLQTEEMKLLTKESEKLLNKHLRNAHQMKKSLNEEDGVVATITSQIKGVANSAINAISGAVGADDAASPGGAANPSTDATAGDATSGTAGATSWTGASEAPAGTPTGDAENGGEKTETFGEKASRLTAPITGWIGSVFFGGNSSSDTQAAVSVSAERTGKDNKDTDDAITDEQLLANLREALTFWRNLYTKQMHKGTLIGYKKVEDAIVLKIEKSQPDLLFITGATPDALVKILDIEPFQKKDGEKEVGEGDAGATFLESKGDTTGSRSISFFEGDSGKVNKVSNNSNESCCSGDQNKDSSKNADKKRTAGGNDERVYDNPGALVLGPTYFHDDYTRSAVVRDILNQILKSDKPNIDKTAIFEDPDRYEGHTLKADIMNDLFTGDLKSAAFLDGGAKSSAFLAEQHALEAHAESEKDYDPSDHEGVGHQEDNVIGQAEHVFEEAQKVFGKEESKHESMKNSWFTQEKKQDPAIAGKRRSLGKVNSFVEANAFGEMSFIQKKSFRGDSGKGGEDYSQRMSTEDHTDNSFLQDRPRDELFHPAEHESLPEAAQRRDAALKREDNMSFYAYQSNSQLSGMGILFNPKRFRMTKTQLVYLEEHPGIAERVGRRVGGGMEVDKRNRHKVYAILGMLQDTLAIKKGNENGLSPRDEADSDDVDAISGESHQPLKTYLCAAVVSLEKAHDDPHRAGDCTDEAVARDIRSKQLAHLKEEIGKFCRYTDWSTEVDGPLNVVLSMDGGYDAEFPSANPCPTKADDPSWRNFAYIDPFDKDYSTFGKENQFINYNVGLELEDKTYTQTVRETPSIAGEPPPSATPRSSSPHPQKTHHALKNQNKGADVAGKPEKEDVGDKNEVETNDEASEEASSQREGTTNNPDDADQEKDQGQEGDDVNGYEEEDWDADADEADANKAGSNDKVLKHPKAESISNSNSYGSISASPGWSHSHGDASSHSRGAQKSDSRKSHGTNMAHRALEHDPSEYHEPVYHPPSSRPPLKNDPAHADAGEHTGATMEAEVSEEAEATGDVAANVAVAASASNDFSNLELPKMPVASAAATMGSSFIQEPQSKTQQIKTEQMKQQITNSANGAVVVVPTAGPDHIVSVNRIAGLFHPDIRQWGRPEVRNTDYLMIQNAAPTDGKTPTFPMMFSKLINFKELKMFPSGMLADIYADGDAVDDRSADVKAGTLLKIDEERDFLRFLQPNMKKDETSAHNALVIDVGWVGTPRDLHIPYHSGKDPVIPGDQNPTAFFELKKHWKPPLRSPAVLRNKAKTVAKSVAGILESGIMRQGNWRLDVQIFLLEIYREFILNWTWTELIEIVALFNFVVFLSVMKDTQKRRKFFAKVAKHYKIISQQIKDFLGYPAAAINLGFDDRMQRSIRAGDVDRRMNTRERKPFNLLSRQTVLSKQTCEEDIEKGKSSNNNSHSMNSDLEGVFDLPRDVIGKPSYRGDHSPLRAQNTAYNQPSPPEIEMVSPYVASPPYVGSDKSSYMSGKTPTTSPYKERGGGMKICGTSPFERSSPASMFSASPLGQSPLVRQSVMLEWSPSLPQTFSPPGRSPPHHTRPV